MTSTLTQWRAARQSFHWPTGAELFGPPVPAPGQPVTPPGLNIGYEAVDRHVTGPAADTVALRFVEPGRVRAHLTYRELARVTNRFANVLAGLGVRPGERVFTLAGRIPALYVAVLGALKYRAVAAPLFAAFGPEPIRQRLVLGDGVVLVTTEDLYRRRVAGIRDQLPALRHVLVVRPPGAAGPPPEGTLDFDALLAAAGEDFTVGPTDPEDMALLHFTSGTTGTPKGAVHVHGAVVAHHLTAAWALDLHPGDVYWCTADPGWITGTSYGIIAPLTHGVTVVVEDGPFEALRWYRILTEQQVTVWYTAPTAIRMLMRAGTEVVPATDMPALRHVASVGEPLNPEAVVWGRRVWERTIHDTWWQTETGAIMIANLPGSHVEPGAMGYPVPGVQAGLLAQGEDGRAQVVDGHVRELTDPVATGELALRAGWPSMFRGYLHDDTRYAACFADGWYRTGDIARRDAAGRYWFVARADDVIKSAGHLVGPFEVESVLMEHPAVVEAGVIGVPDPVAGERVKAFVSLHRGYLPDERLRADITAFARRRLGAVAPKEIAFEDNLPKTSSGKVMRRLLKARELGLPEGDLSTLAQMSPESKP